MSRSTLPIACNSLAIQLHIKNNADIGTERFRLRVSNADLQELCINDVFFVIALQEYSPRILKHYKRLMSIFSTHAASTEYVDASKLFMDLFFDVVSDLTLGESFNTLTTGERNSIFGEFLQHQKSVGFILLNMWVFHLVRSIPVVASRIVYMMRWYASAVSKRKEVRERSSRKHTWYADALKRRRQVRVLFRLANPTDFRR